MKFKGIIILLALVVAGATLFTAVAGHSRSSFGPSGSVGVDTSMAVRTNNTIHVDYIFLPHPDDGIDGISGKMFCLNPGSMKHPPAGIQKKVPQFGASKDITEKDVNEHGRAEFSVIALAELDPALVKEICPNKNYTLKFYPQRFEAVIAETEILDDGSMRSRGFQRVRCVHPDWEHFVPGDGSKYDCPVIEEFHAGGYVE